MTAGRGSRVQIVVDDTCCLTEERAAAHGITVLPLPLDLEDGDPKTSALQPLPLAVAYARAQERAGDRGVVALHLSKALSSTWQNAQTAAAAVGACEAPDTATVGAAIGEAAVAAAEAAESGAGLDECLATAESVLQRARLWIYVPKLDTMRRGGRISAGQAVLSTALAIKPIIGLSDGALHVEAKCRTEAKALEGIVTRCVDAAAGHPAHAIIQHSGAGDIAAGVADVLELRLPAGSTVESVDLPPALIAHAGPEACGVTIIASEDVRDDAQGDANDPVDRAGPPAADAAGVARPAPPLVTQVTSKLPTWSTNRRAAKERAEALRQAMTEVTARDNSDPEGAAFGRESADGAADGHTDGDAAGEGVHRP